MPWHTTNGTRRTKVQAVATRRNAQRGFTLQALKRLPTVRPSLERTKASGDIFFAVSDRDWVLDGANVHVSMVGFDDGRETERTLDGDPVEVINANLSSLADILQQKNCL